MSGTGVGSPEGDGLRLGIASSIVIDGIGFAKGSRLLNGVGGSSVADNGTGLADADTLVLKLDLSCWQEMSLG